MSPNFITLLQGRTSVELGGELLGNLLPSLSAAAGDLDVLLAQNDVRALDRLDRVIERLEVTRWCAFHCRAALCRERELVNPE